MNIIKSKALKKREAKEAESLKRFKTTEEVPTKREDEEREYLAYLEGRSDPRD